MTEANSSVIALVSSYAGGAPLSLARILLAFASMSRFLPCVPEAVPSVLTPFAPWASPALGHSRAHYAGVQDALVAGCAVAREPAPMGETQEEAAQASCQARGWACRHNSARSASTTSAGREGHTAAELQRGGASHPRTGA